jgi:hypothetical protein
MFKIEKQSAIHPSDQFKLFPMMMLRQYARRSYAWHRAILGCFVQIRTAPAQQAAALGNRWKENSRE